MRRVWVRGHENVRKRVLIQAAALQHRTAPAPPDRRRYAPEPAGAGCFGDLPLDRASDRPLGASEARLGVQMDPDGARRLNRSSPSCLNSGAQRTDFFHGLQGIPCLRDRVAQTAAMLVLSPVFEADLQPEQYAYRSGRHAHDAVNRVHRLLSAGHREVVDADLSTTSARFPTRP